MLRTEVQHEAALQAACVSVCTFADLFVSHHQVLTVSEPGWSDKTLLLCKGLASSQATVSWQPLSKQVAVGSVMKGEGISFILQVAEPYSSFSVIPPSLLVCSVLLFQSGSIHDRTCKCCVPGIAF